eukprot:gene4904-27811_t
MVQFWSGKTVSGDRKKGMLALYIVGAHCAATAAMPNLATTYLLTDAVDKTGARCLDGSPQRYWLQRATGANATKWSFHHMGGGWCESVESCAARAYGKTQGGDCYIGSSNESCFATAGARNPGTESAFNSTMDFQNIPSCNGMMMNNPKLNPLTYDWNKVLIPYCDGGSFAGNNESVSYVDVRGKMMPLYFRGFRNLNAVLDDLVANHGLGDVTDALVSGDSAGGLASHADRYKQRFSSANIVVAPDSGFFFSDPSFPTWSDALHWVSYMNSTAGLDQSCVAAMVALGEDPLECRWPEVVVKFIDVPVFVMNSRFDPALDGISGGTGGKNSAGVVRVGSMLEKLVNSTVLTAPKNAAFITSCAQHCGQWAQGQVQGHVKVKWPTEEDGSSGDATRKAWFQQSPYPCETCCAGGQH